MIDTVYTYLINTTKSIIDGYTESLPPDETLAAVYRITGGTTSKSLKKSRQYTIYPVNVLVRGNQNSKELVDICDSMVTALDLDQTGVIITSVTSEPQFAFTDDNGNLVYTFSVQVTI